MVATGEGPEHEQRERDAQGIAEDKQLVQLKRPVERRAEGGDRGGGISEESLCEKEDEQHVGEPEQRLAERDRPEVIAGQEAERGERVRVEGRLVKDVRATPPSLP